jgi:hypothetical protein
LLIRALSKKGYKLSNNILYLLLQELSPFGSSRFVMNLYELVDDLDCRGLRHMEDRGFCIDQQYLEPAILSGSDSNIKCVLKKLPAMPVLDILLFRQTRVNANSPLVQDLFRNSIAGVLEAVDINKITRTVLRKPALIPVLFIAQPKYFEAVQEYEQLVVKELIRGNLEGPDIFFLHAGIEIGDWIIVFKAFEESKYVRTILNYVAHRKQANELRNKSGQSPLHIAAWSALGDPAVGSSVVKSLLDSGADVHQIDPTKNLSLLQILVYHEMRMPHELQIMTLLLDAGADSNLVSPEHRYVLAIARWEQFVKYIYLGLTDQNSFMSNEVESRVLIQVIYEALRRLKVLL